MKNKRLIITSLLFFLIVNTNYFWVGKLGDFSILIMVFLIITYFIFVLILLQQLFLVFREKLKNKKRFLSIGVVSVLLFLIYIKPNGLINFDKLQGKDLLIAEREGSANCMTTLKLKENGKFRERNVCFGVTEINGDYEEKNDTIFFTNVNLGRGEKEYFKFAVIKNVKYNNLETFNLVRYESIKDTIGKELWIKKNELINSKSRTQNRIISK